MKKTMKKILAFLLTLMMVMQMLPVSAFAAGTGGKITFTTTFSNNLSKGDTFTVTATLSDNPGIASFTNILKWNEDVVKFTGFTRKTSGNKKPISDVFADDSITASDTTGGFAVALDYDNDVNGVLYTANFEISAEKGELGLGLTTTEFGKDFTFANLDGDDIVPELDFSAIEGLTVGGVAVGPAMPENAPFTAITTDAGSIAAVELTNPEFGGYSSYIDSYEAPLYTVVIPQNSTEIYVTIDYALDDFTDQLDYSTGEGVWIGVAGMVSNVNKGDDSDASYFVAEETAEGKTIITIPVEFYSAPMWGDAVQYSIVRESEDEDVYAVAPQMQVLGNQPLCFLTFEYDDGSANVPTYALNFDNIVGGTVTAYSDADYTRPITEAKADAVVYLDYKEEEGYTFQSWGYTYNGTFYHVENGAFNMPEGDITISAHFKAPTYAVTVNSAQNGTVTADKAAASAGEKVTLTVTPDDEYTLDTLTVMQGETTIEVINNEFTMPAGAVTVSATFKKAFRGYTFATSADVSAENGGTAVVHVKITGHTDSAITTYNSYDLTLTYDNSKLEFVSGVGADAGDQIRIEKKGENQIQIIGVGDAKGFDVEVAALTFKSIAEGNATVTIDKAQVSDQQTAVDENVPEATPKHDEAGSNVDETPDVSVIVVPYSVTKPDFITGTDKILHGNDYTFSYTDTQNYTYSDLTVTVGGAAVTPVLEDGNYTIENVTGTVVITATQTAKSYSVTFNENNTAIVEGAETATYGEDYIFTVSPSTEDMAIESVVITDANEEKISYTINDNGEYVIAGTAITGAFTITVTETDTRTTVTFSGIEAEEVEGGLTQTGKIGKKFTFKLNKIEGFEYIVMVGENVLEENDGEYTIDAELMVPGGVLVSIEKVDNTKAVVNVSEYITMDGKSMFLITAKWGDKVLAYGQDTMYWSDKYTVTGDEEAGAYCWLVVSTDEMNTVEDVKTAAEAAITEASEGATVTAVKYDYDINGTTKVDVNDAQLAYDMYNASYMEFTENLSMLKFLEADMKTDAKLDTQDVAAIISYIVSGANE